MSKYEESGVSIHTGDSFVEHIRKICQSTYNDNVIEGVGGFCSLYQLPNSNQLLAASTDGVGTKSILAEELSEFGYLKTLGIDLVGMVVNDIITCGANPLFMLDCYSLNKLSRNFERSVALVQGIADGCKLSQCFCLIGGETAEMPDVYMPRAFEISGFGVGIVDKDERLGQHRVRAGDVVIGLPSTGPHSNGFTLIRQAFRNYDWIRDSLDVRDWIMEPTRIYTPVMRNLLAHKTSKIHAAAHITGGGLEANTSRSIPDHLKLKIDWDSWVRPRVFNEIKHRGKIAEDEMRQVFNNGVGFTLIVDPLVADDIILQIRSQSGLVGYIIGEVT